MAGGLQDIEGAELSRGKVSTSHKSNQEEGDTRIILYALDAMYQ